MGRMIGKMLINFSLSFKQFGLLLVIFKNQDILTLLLQGIFDRNKLYTYLMYNIPSITGLKICFVNLTARRNSKELNLHLECENYI
jgi:hypothetical protein